MPIQALRTERLCDYGMLISLDSILAAIWNNDVHRETCKIVVDVMADHIEACHKLHMAAISA